MCLQKQKTSQLLFSWPECLFEVTQEYSIVLFVFLMYYINNSDPVHLDRKYLLE